MAGPGLPTNIDATYADSSPDGSATLHQQYHDTIHRLLNQFDVGAVPTEGQVWSWLAAAGLYKPRTLLLPTFTTNQGLLAFNRETAAGAYDPLPADIGSVGVVWIGTDDPVSGTRTGDLRYRLP